MTYSAPRWRAAAVVALALLLAPLGAFAQKAELTLLHINDVYEISPKRGKGGMAELMTLLRGERARASHHLTTLGGDLISPSVMSGLTKGAQMIELMNAIGLDAAGLGNHEFDFGDEVITHHMAASTFTWLATNTLGPDGKPFGGAQSTMIRQVGELKVGLFSLLTAETTHLSSPGAGVTFTSPEETALKAVESLKAAGADLIVALTHLDLAADRTLAKRVHGIHVILGGHDHDPISLYEGGTLILKAGYNAHYLAVADLKIEKKKGRRGIEVSMAPEWRFVSTSGITPDPEIAALVARHEKTLDEKLAVPVGTTTVALDSQRSTVRGRESNLANLIADAIRASVGADVGLANGGGIRGNRIYDAGTVLTRKDVLSELPFGNTVVLLELTGAQLLETLETGVSRVEDGAGRFPHVSGMRVTYDPGAEKGARILAATVAGRPVEAAGIYRVATNDYIAGGGDGYGVLTEAKTLINADGGTLMATVVMDYIAAKGTIAPAVEGRITTK